MAGAAPAEEVGFGTEGGAPSTAGAGGQVPADGPACPQLCARRGGPRASDARASPLPRAATHGHAWRPSRAYANPKGAEDKEHS